MNSAQRRKQRRAAAPFIGEIQRAFALANKYEGQRFELEQANYRLEAKLDWLKKTSAHELAKLRESTDHEIRKITENAKRLAPLVAELQIALRQIAAAASIVGADPGHMAVADVPGVNKIRQNVICALKGHRED